MFFCIHDTITPSVKIFFSRLNRKLTINVHSARLITKLIIAKDKIVGEGWQKYALWGGKVQDCVKRKSAAQWVGTAAYTVLLSLHRMDHLNCPEGAVDYWRRWDRRRAANLTRASLHSSSLAGSLFLSFFISCFIST